MVPFGLFLKHLSPSHKGPLQNLRPRPQFHLQWVEESELPPLFRTNTPAVGCWHSEGVFVWLCCANVKGEKKSVPQFAIYRRNPHKAGKGLVHSESLNPIHPPQAHLNLQTWSCRTRVALFIWKETGWWNICERWIFTTASYSLNS